jgi:hypothetical protein
MRELTIALILFMFSSFYLAQPGKGAVFIKKSTVAAPRPSARGNAALRIATGETAPQSFSSTDGNELIMQAALRTEHHISLFKRMGAACEYLMNGRLHGQSKKNKKGLIAIALAAPALVAVAALFLSGFSVALGTGFAIGGVCVVLSTLAIILGAKGLSHYNPNRYSLAGMVLGIVGLSIALALGFATLVFVVL